MTYDMYEKVCKDRFNKLEQKNDHLMAGQEEMHKDITAIRQKVFNGFGESIKEIKDEMKNLRYWMIGFMGTVALAILAGLVKFLFFS